MQTWKRWLASVLSVLMLVSALPATAMAENTESEDIVIYNLKNCEVSVGSDAELYEAGELDALFDENGAYTITLENDALFPYEVQFTYDGLTWVEWFTSPDSVVTVGGHDFSVVSERTDPDALVQLGFYVGDEFVLAYPESKFNIAGTFSLLPLRERSLYLDLSEYFPEELKNFSISALAAEMNIDETIAVWARWGYYDENGRRVAENDNYVCVSDENATIDLRSSYRYSSSSYMELIVGTADQLDPDNTRYEVYISTGSMYGFFDVSMYTTDDPREEIETYSSSLGSAWFSSESGQTERDYLSIVVNKADLAEGEEAYLSIGLAETRDDITATVFEGYYENLEDIPEDANDITDEMGSAGPCY